MSLNKLKDQNFEREFEGIFEKRNKANKSVSKIIQIIINEPGSGALVSPIVFTTNANFGNTGKIKAISVVYFSVTAGGIGTFRTGYLEVNPSKDYNAKFQQATFSIGANYLDSAIIPISNGQPLTTWRGSIPFDNQTDFIIRCQPLENVPVGDFNTVYTLLEVEFMNPYEF